MTIYIYGLRCPLADAIRYIGKSDDPDRRFKAHLGSAARDNSHKARWLAKLARSGLTPTLEIIRDVPDGDDWAAAEREEIARARALGWPLTNMTLGGEGAVLDEVGRAAKLRAMGKPETRERMSRSAKARWSDPEKGAKGRAENGCEERRKKLSAGAKRRATPEYRAMMADKSRAAWADEEKSARIKAGITDEVRDKVSSASKRFWATSPNAAKCRANLLPPTPEMVAKATAARLTPEALARRREWSSSPEHRAKLSAALKASWERRKREG